MATAETEEAEEMRVEEAEDGGDDGSAPAPVVRQVAVKLKLRLNHRRFQGTVIRPSSQHQHERAHDNKILVHHKGIRQVEVHRRCQKGSLNEHRRLQYVMVREIKHGVPANVATQVTNLQIV